MAFTDVCNNFSLKAYICYGKQKWLYSAQNYFNQFRQNFPNFDYQNETVRQHICDIAIILARQVTFQKVSCLVGRQFLLMKVSI